MKIVRKGERKKVKVEMKNNKKRKWKKEVEEKVNNSTRRKGTL